jgi:hypothetical protein
VGIKPWEILDAPYGKMQSLSVVFAKLMETWLPLPTEGEARTIGWIGREIAVCAEIYLQEMKR